MKQSDREMSFHLKVTGPGLYVEERNRGLFYTYRHQIFGVKNYFSYQNPKNC